MAPRPDRLSRDTHSIPGRRAVEEALRAGRDLRHVAVERDASPELERLAAKAEQAGIAVRRLERRALDDLAEGVVHQGVVAAAPRFPYRSLAEVSDTDLVVVLDGITDPHNVGAIARSAEAAGAGALVLRERRGALVTPAVEKAAAGALSWVQVAVVPNLVRALEDLAKRGFWSVGLAGEASEQLWSSPLLEGNVALTVGAEGEGLSRLVAERVDGLVQIPMQGRVGSLNASVAAGIALFEITRRRSV